MKGQKELRAYNGRWERYPVHFGHFDSMDKLSTEVA